VEVIAVPDGEENDVEHLQLGDFRIQVDPSVRLVYFSSMILKLNGVSSDHLKYLM
jgi:hypothetical protein